MRLSPTFLLLLTLAAGVLTGPTLKRTTAPTNTTDATPALGDDLGRCTPCNDKKNECMGKWPCWFYDCQASCDHEVCENLPDCRQGCGFHC